MNEETADTINEAAIAWVARLDRDPGECDGLDAWLVGDPRRRGAYLRAQAAWTMLDRASLLGDSRQEPDPADEPASADATALDIGGRGVSRRHLIAGSAAIAASLAAGGAWLFLPLGDEHIATATGEIRRVPLADGSVASVNTDSRLSVAIRPEIRRVALAKGEAWFQVAHDRTRPFVVEAGEIRVRAIGTAFSVRRYESGAAVQVTEGIVEAWKRGEEAHPVRIAAGARAFVSETATIPVAPQLASAEIDRKLAWRVGQIILDGDTLAEAAAEFNRYNAQQLVIPDPVLAREKLVGRFRTNEPDAFARAAAGMLGARADIGTTEIRLTRE